MKIALLKVSIDDAELIFNSWGKNPENFTYLSAPSQANIDDSKEYLSRALKNTTDLVFHIVEEKTKEVVGIVRAKIENNKALVGYVVDKAYWGNGIASNAVLALLPLLQSNPDIHKIWATCSVENPASSKVLEKCGFRREAVLKNWISYPAQGSQLHDNYSYTFAKDA